MRAILASIFVLFTCACTTKPLVKDEDLLVKDQFDFEPKEHLSKTDIRSDTDLLLYALKNGYGGRKYVDQSSFNKTISDLDNINLDSVSSEDYCTEIQNKLLQIPDMHLNARIKDHFCGDVSKKRFVEGKVGKNYLKDGDKTWAVNYISVKNKKVPVISILSFPSREDKIWEGFLDSIGRVKNSAPAMIIDLRGNGGGDDSMGLAMASYLFGQDPPTSVQEIVKSQTPATFALSANSPKIRILKLKIKNQIVPEFLDKKLQSNMEKFKLAQDGKLPLEASVIPDQGKPFDSKKAFNDPIIVLMDKGCASSCESTVEALILHPWVTTVGENTGGFLHFGNLGMLVLPRSQITIQIATDFWKYKDGRYLEGIGYEPKMKVAPGKDAFEAAKTYLNSVLR